MDAQVIMNGRMRGVKKLLYLVSVSFSRELQYRANFFINIIKLSIPIVVNLFFWNAAFSNSADSVIYGYSYSNMIKYIICVNLVNMVISVNFAYEVAGDIHRGRLSNFIIKPISYTKYRMFCHIGSKMPTLIFFFIGLGVFVGISIGSGNYDVTVHGTLYFIVGLLLACMLNNFMFYCISLSAFWFTQTGYMFWVVQELARILSGAVFPLTVFGARYISISNLLPFQYVVYFPSNIFLNNISSQEIALGIGMQIIWIFLLWKLSKVLWKYGTKKYIAVGG